MDGNELSRDTSGTRSFSQFIVELTNKIPAYVLPNISLLSSHLDGDVWVFSYAEVICQYVLKNTSASFEFNFTLLMNFDIGSNLLLFASLLFFRYLMIFCCSGLHLSFKEGLNFRNSIAKFRLNFLFNLIHCFYFSHIAWEMVSLVYLQKSLSKY